MNLQKKLDFKDMKFPVKVRDITKLIKRLLSTLVFLDIKIKKNMYVSKNLRIKNMLSRKTC